MDKNFYIALFFGGCIGLIFFIIKIYLLLKENNHDN